MKHKKPQRLMKEAVLLAHPELRMLYGPATLSRAARKSPSACVTRRGHIDGFDFFVLDGLFSKREISEIARIAASPLMMHLEAAKTLINPHYAQTQYHVPVDLPLFGRMSRCVEALYPRRLAHGPLEALCNKLRYGDDAPAHADTSPDAPAVTAIYFANGLWKPEWHGEIVFYDRKHEPTALVAPKPGRVVLFRSEITHRAGIPDRSCRGWRITIAAQYGSAYGA